MMELLRLTISLLCICYIAMASESISQVVNGNTKLWGDLYNILVRDEGNILFSPFSIHAMLSLVYQGTAGDTRKLFERVLALSGTDEVAESYHDLMTKLNSAENVIVNVANKLFVKQQYKLKEQFSSVARKQFFSDVDNVDFKISEVAANYINAWVKEETNKKITDIIHPHDLDARTRFVSVNAIYFLGKWMHEFEAELTAKKIFYLSKNHTVKCNLMRSHQFLFYGEDSDLDAEIVALPYENTDFNMLIFVPKSKTGLKKLEKKLRTKNLSSIKRNMHPAYIKLLLPKFKIEKAIDLKSILVKLGMGAIFDGPADFSNMIDSPEEILVSKVVTKTFIDINEVGTEAGAVSAGAGGCRIASPRKSVVADRPFAFAITYSPKEEVLPLFFGRLVKP